MKRTILWPPKVLGGRLAMTEDPSSDPVDPGAALRQIIRLNLLDGSHANPFHGTGGVPDATFRAADPTTRARLRSDVREVFRRLERTHRAKLIGQSFAPPDPDAPGRLVLQIEYEDLETGGRQNMEIARNG